MSNEEDGAAPPKDDRAELSDSLLVARALKTSEVAGGPILMLQRRNLLRMEKNEMGAADKLRVLDFGPMGMWWEITKSTADTDGELFEAINVLAPDFAGPPLHIHPKAEEIYEVVAGTLSVCVDGQWRKLVAGESITVPPGTAHTLKNESGEEVRLINVHRPALDFERFFRGLHSLSSSGSVTFPPKGLRSAILLSMLFSEHPQEVISVKPPRWLMTMLARVGRILRCRLPSNELAGMR